VFHAGVESHKAILVGRTTNPERVQRVPLTGALLDRLTHHVHILSMNGERYRLTQSARRRKPAAMDVGAQSAGEAVDPDTGEITTR
jgi:hypothetical protein